MAEAASMSRAAGRSFGRLWFSRNPGLTLEQAQTFAESLRPKSPLLISVYKKSFVEAFIQERNAAVLRTYGKTEFEVPGGNMLPDLEENNQMSIISEIDAQLSDRTIKYKKAREFHQADCIFNVETMDKVQSDFGLQWKMKVEVRLDTINPDMDLGIDEGDTIYLTLSAGGRDAKMEKLKSMLPLHNCFITMTPLKGNKIYYDILDLDKTDPAYIAPPKERRGTRQASARPARIANKTVPTDLDTDPFLDTDDLP